MSKPMTKSRENVRSAFAAACQEATRLRIYAAQADAEGKKGLAALLAAAARSRESIAAHMFSPLGRLGSSLANTQAALEEASYNADSMYPRAIRQAEIEEDAEAVELFRRAEEVCSNLQTLLAEAFQSLKSGRDPGGREYGVCDQCGNVTIGATSCSRCAAGSSAAVSPATAGAARH